MDTRTPIERQIDTLVDLFDTDKIHRIMHFLDWVWMDAGDDESGVASTKEIRKKAKEYLTTAYKETTPDQKGLCSSGGIRAECEMVEGKYFFTLRFDVVEVDSTWLDEWVE